MSRRLWWPAWLVLVTAAYPAASTPPLVVTHAALWTEHGILLDHEIVIRDGRIAAVGRSASLERPRDADVIDAAGDTLLPGLIDAHVHLVMGVRVPPAFTGEQRARVAAQQLLRSGVTTGRIHLWDIDSAATFARESAHDSFPGPRLLVGGPALFGGRPEWNAPTANVWGVSGVDDAVAKVRRLQAAGATWLALHELTRFAPGELEAIAAEARRLGLRLLAGGDQLPQIERAVEIGADSIEYLDRSDAALYPDELIARMRARGRELFLVPVIGFPHRFAAYRNGAMPLDDPRYTEFMSSEAAAFFTAALHEDRTKEIQWAPNDGLVPARTLDKFRQLRAAGLQFVTGTDCGSPVHLHADAIWWELETMRQLGLAPHECIQAATTTAAALLHDTTIGHLGVGARGDFVIYRGRIDEGSFRADRVRVVARDGVLRVRDGRWIEASGHAVAGSTSDVRQSTNSLGMRFVPVPGIAARVSIWETRVRDFAAFMEASGHISTGDVYSLDPVDQRWKVHPTNTWQSPGFPQTPDHPVVNVSWNDANAFCRWFTEHERAAGTIAAAEEFRLPTDAEWSAAAGPARFPWGEQWPPPARTGNFWGLEHTDSRRTVLEGYDDGEPFVAAVGSYPPNVHGLYDLSGNVWEWCSDHYRKELNPADILEENLDLANDRGGTTYRVMRGGGWVDATPRFFRNDFRSFGQPFNRYCTGFRVVLALITPLRATIRTLVPPLQSEQTRFSMTYPLKTGEQSRTPEEHLIIYP